ncbi:M23 family metallopeptidase [Pseudochryseolinea flava]|uniref:M23 family peptidase n=1 Tax=Pseudochryseolinea flava TaxID=2059302 RepID=A0A364XUY8_9BACT|nr:M23 family metallopeptidase [Pseudochryseolinea flava]RAV97941.1 M23 family peptidase [Pseudochryseolinea flava]
MARTKYIYNPETCRYETYYVRGKTLRKRVLIFISTALGLAIATCSFYVKKVGSFDEMRLTQKNILLKTEWHLLEDQIAKSNQHLQELIEKDDHNYRIILDSHPLTPEIREAGIGGSEKFDTKILKHYPYLLSGYTRAEKLKHQLDVEVQSFEELSKMMEERVEMWASRPAIQPISNKQLDNLHLTYGSRFHPILKIYREHKGLDFTAEKGTPVYATGDGEIAMAYFSDSYGNVIYLNHSYGYETRYAHLSAFAVKPGDKVKRGQVIGYVGNSGTSVSAHLHYEVLYKGQHANPINFFQRDLNNKEYEKLIEIGSQQDRPLD